MSTECYNSAVKRPFSRYVVTGDHIISYEIAIASYVRDETLVRNYVVEVPRNSIVRIADKIYVVAKQKRRPQAIFRTVSGIAVVTFLEKSEIKQNMRSEQLLSIFF